MNFLILVQFCIQNNAPTPVELPAALIEIIMMRAVGLIIIFSKTPIDQATVRTFYPLEIALGLSVRNLAAMFSAVIGLFPLYSGSDSVSMVFLLNSTQMIY